MNNIKIGIIGCGKQASKHIASLKNIPGVELVLCDMQSNLARDLAERNAEAWVEGSEEIFSDESIRAIIICTPTRTHTQLIRGAVEAGKNIFCEKPVSDSMDEAIKIKQCMADSGLILMIGYIYRFVPIFEEGYEFFQKNSINGDSLIMERPLSAFFRLGGRGGHQLWKHQKDAGGGALNEMMVHMIDLANWYFGPLQNIEVVSCGLYRPERMIQGQKYQVDAEDHIWVKLIGANGVEIFCQADLITPAFSQYVEIQSNNGTFMGSIQSDMPSYVFLKESRGGYRAGRTDLQYGRRNVLDRQMMAFIQAILRKESHDRNTIDDSLELMRIMNEIRNQVEAWLNK